MKFILIIAFLISPIIKAAEITRWVSDYDPNLGRVSITYLDQNRVLIEEDRNSCALDMFGNLSGCTAMAPIVSIDTTTLMLQNEGRELFQFGTASHLRLSKTDGVPRILKMDPATGAPTLSLRMYPTTVTVPEFLIPLELDLQD